jgi:UDP-glucose 4-epimerase
MDQAGLAEVIATARPDLCIHAGGRASVGDSIKDPAPDFEAGPVLTFAMLDAIRREAPQCGFVLLSSAAVYGDPRSLPIGEHDKISPISPYGAHKRISELLCKEFQDLFAIRTAVVRIFSAYGEGLRRQVLWDICRQLAKGESIELHGTGRESRDFIHVTDVAAGILLVAEKGLGRGVFNIGSGRETTVAELAGIAASVLSPEGSPRFDGRVPPGDPVRWRADVARIQDLGFRCSIALEQGVAAYAEWVRRECLEEVP